MNIFYLDENPTTCAQMHCDKHVVKMIIELAQLLSTAHRVLDGIEYYDKTSNGRKIKRHVIDDERDEILYKTTHINHPSAIWVRETCTNYNWTYQLFVALCKEYTHRYGKVHLTEKKLKDSLFFLPQNIKDAPMTTIPQAMPDYCKKINPIDGYRNYYILEKKSFLNYTNREKPSWIK